MCWNTSALNGITTASPSLIKACLSPFSSIHEALNGIYLLELYTSTLFPSSSNHEACPPVPNSPAAFAFAANLLINVASAKIS